MSFGAPGGNYVPAYQMSGLPFAQTGTIVTSNTLSLNFPMVTKFFVVSCSVPTFMGFTQNGVAGSNRFLLSPGQSPVFELRVRDLYFRNESGVTSSINVLAGLTAISVHDYPFVSSSFITGSNRMIYNGVG